MTYLYSRGFENGQYLINNSARIDAESNTISLASEIKQILNKVCKIICHELECKIIFDEDLTEEQKQLLDTIIQQHKQNL